MKKFIMVAVMAVAALTANAQTWAGGSFGFQSKHVNGSESSTTLFEVSPEMGYSLSDNLDVAIALSYANINGDQNTFAIKPYLRYSFVKEGNFAAFLDCGLGYGTTHTNGIDKNDNFFTVNINPGIAYNVSNKVTLVAHLGDGLYFSHEWKEDVKRINTFGLNFFNGVSFGAYYNF